MEIGFLIATCVFLFVMAVLILFGKVDFLLNSLKRPGAEKLILWRIRLINALTLFVVMAFVVSIHFVQAARNGGKIVWILVAVLLVVTGALQILERTWAKRS